jgi:hypothetical protein
MSLIFHQFDSALARTYSASGQKFLPVSARAFLAAEPAASAKIEERFRRNG